MVDGNQPRLVEVDDLLQRLDHLEDVLAVSRRQLGQDDILGRVGPGERGGAGPVAQAADAAEVRDEGEMAAVPGEQVRARARAPAGLRNGTTWLPAISSSAWSSESGHCTRSQSTRTVLPSPAWTRSGGIAVAPAGVPTTYCWVTLPDRSSTRAPIAELDERLVWSCGACPQVERQPVAPLRGVLEEHGRPVHRGVEEVRPAVAVEIRGHADGVARAGTLRSSRFPGSAAAASTNRCFGQSLSSSAGPRVPSLAMGIGDDDVEVAVVVDVDELAAGSAERAVLGRELGVALEFPSAPIAEERQFLAGEDQQVAVAGLERVARGRH